MFSRISYKRGFRAAFPLQEQRVVVLWRSIFSGSDSQEESGHQSNNTTTAQNTSETDDAKRLEMDFFGEPVTFLGAQKDDKISNAMAAMDGFLLAAVSKGRTCVGGGMEFGLDVKSAHSVALSWSEAAKFATFWNHPKGDDTIPEYRRAAPMLAAVTVSPLLANTSASYTMHLDSLLAQTTPIAKGMPVVQMMGMAEAAIAYKEHPDLDSREHMHLQTLQLLMEDKHSLALLHVLRILRICPGDALALSLAMDLAQTLGDKEAAMQAAGSVVAYWTERKGGFIKPSIPGHSMAMSLVALGFAVGGKNNEAELFAEVAMNQGSNVCGALATWAQAHVFDAGGRVAEGISAMSNFDGKSNYEGAGFLYFDCLLGGYGARFSLDREERGRGKSAALRLYGTHFERVLEQSGFSIRQPFMQPTFKAPLGWTTPIMLTDKDKDEEEESSSWSIRRFFGITKEQKEMKEHYDLVVQQENQGLSTRLENWSPTCEDVLTWLPPTPRFLADATLLLFRMTLNGTVSSKNARWDELRNAWESYVDVHRKYHATKPLSADPLVLLSASIIMPPSETGADKIGTGALARGLHKMGELLELGHAEDPEATKAVREVVAENDPNFWLPVESDGTNEWQKVVRDLLSAIEGVDPDHIEESYVGVDVSSLRYRGWTFDARPILEHAIVYSACKSGDIDSLSVARSICSAGVTLRPVSPEEWWRYSIVLGLLGDVVASEDAWNMSINVGAGQGARKMD